MFKPYASIGTNLLFFEKGEPTKDIWFYEHRVPEGQKAYSMTKPIRLEHLQGCIDWWGGAKRKGREETPQAWKVTAEEVKARGYNLDIKNPHTVADDHGDPETLLADLERRRGRDGELARPVEGDPRRGAGAMNAERLLAHYERIADAPDAIARLRRFILDLAVRGKLVPQEAGDQPAKRSTKPTDPSSPFGLPKNWRWAHIGDQLELLNGMAFKPTDWVGAGLRIVKIQNLNNPKAPFHFCDPAMARERSLIDDGAFLISWSGTPGTSFGAPLHGVPQDIQCDHRHGVVSAAHCGRHCGPRRDLACPRVPRASHCGSFWV